MKKNLPSLIFYSLLFIIFVIEGWGLPVNRTITLHTILFAPFFLFLIPLFTRKSETILPSPVSIAALLFILTVFAFTLFSVDIGRAFEHRLLYISIFLMALFAYNYQKHLAKHFSLFLSVITINTFLYAVFIGYFLPEKLDFLKTSASFQFVRSSQGMGHDIRGAFILIPLAFLLGVSFHKPIRLKVVATIFLFILLIASLLRAGYVAIATVALLFQKQWRIASRKIYIYVGIFVLFISFIITTNIAHNIPGASQIHDRIFEETNLVYKKSTFTTRLEILQQAGRSIAGHPITGIGSFDYYYASLRYAKNLATIMGSSHNILIDTAVENGIPAAVFFTVAIILLLLNCKYVLNSGTTTQKGIFAVFIALLVLFFFSHYHKMYFLLTVFFITGALLYKEKKEIVVKSKWIFVIALLLALVNSYIIFAKVTLYRGYPTRALSLYPIYAAGYQFAAAHAYATHDFTRSSAYLEHYASFYSHNPLVLEFIGSMYKSMENNPKALEYYKRAIIYAPIEITYLRELTELIEKVEGQTAAETFIHEYVDSHDLIKNNPYDEDTKILLGWCKQRQYDCGDK